MECREYITRLFSATSYLLLSHGTAWGLFDKNGERDEIGTLNLLTQDAVIKAREEIRSGKSIALNWGMEKLHEPGFGRAVLSHKFINWREKPGYSFFSFDDEIMVNTQTGWLTECF
jgi:hypothetical protein